MFLEPEPLARGDDSGRCGIDRLDRVVGRVDPAVAVAGEHENAPLVRRLGLPLRVPCQRRDHRSLVVAGGADVSCPPVALSLSRSLVPRFARRDAYGLSARPFDMTTVTLIGTRLADTGREFVYQGSRPTARGAPTGASVSTSPKGPGTA